LIHNASLKQLNIGVNYKLDLRFYKVLTIIDWVWL